MRFRLRKSEFYQVFLVCLDLLTVLLPGEGWRRLPLDADPPAGQPVHLHALRAPRPLVDVRGNYSTEKKIRKLKFIFY